MWVVKERRPRIPEDLAQRIDEARGMVPFEPWVRQALEEALREASPSWERPPAMATLQTEGPAKIDGAASPQVSAHVRPAIPKKGS